MTSPVNGRVRYLPEIGRVVVGEIDQAGVQTA
jgi:hypothetical protein